MSAAGWVPGRDPRAVRHPAAAGSRRSDGRRPVLVAGGGIAGLAAATGLAERGVPVTLVEAQPQLGGRVRAWPVEHPDAGGPPTTMSRGFHAFFRQYYNLRSLLRRSDPGLDRLVPLEDYPLVLADGHRDSFASIPRTPPLSIATFVAQSPSFTAADLARVDIPAALELLDVDFPSTFSRYDGESAADFLDRLRFPADARHLALEVFARSFFAHPTEFAAGELVAMFHSYFTGSAEGLLFDVPRDDYDTSLWAPLGRHLHGLGVEVLTSTTVEHVAGSGDDLEVTLGSGEQRRVGGVVVATDPGTTRRLVTGSPLFDEDYADRVGAGRNAPPFAVWRLWLDRRADVERSPFLGTSGFGPLDNVSLLERFEDGARRWSDERGGSVVELHAYALQDPWDESAVRAELRHHLDALYPELAGAAVLAQEWLVSQDCPLASTAPWQLRPEVATPDPRVVLAGDGVRCDYPVALMERAATTGWLAANALLAREGVAGHDLWTVPMRSRHPVAGRVRRLLTRTA
ncbi:isorenieratene synthase [Friedmanniella luteola]|uniref:Isorenieratene synthase n=1 Tax=Friedmanniella luteola TaxID=546871 RepID=A0A1H1LLP8_9ACTN|nr:FAD-dependent oxidoreductase [Friedmanniella luteola]SDR75302.1 isorenieratene synthase [Friedmanniella luteola]